MQNDPKKPSPGVSRDDCPELLCGASEIAEFIFGDRQARRKVYHFYEQHDLPGFKVGNGLYARRSTILKWIEDKEK